MILLTTRSGRNRRVPPWAPHRSGGPQRQHRPGPPRHRAPAPAIRPERPAEWPRRPEVPSAPARGLQRCLLYTSDAADEEDSVDLGGRRIIKKKKKKKT